MATYRPRTNGATQPDGEGAASDQIAAPSESAAVAAAPEPSESASPFTGSEGSPTPASKKKHGRRLTTEEIEAIWQDWKDGERNITDLARKHDVSWGTIKQCVHFGHPSRGVRSFQDRYALELGDSRVSKKEIAEKAAEYIAKVVVDEWERVISEDRHLVGGMKIVLAQLLDKLKAAIHTFSFTRTIRVKDQSGAWTSIVVPLEGNEIVQAARALARAVREVVHTEAMLFNKPDIGEADKTNQPGWLDNLTDEQLDHILKTGQIPPGVPDEAIFGRGRIKAANRN